MCYYFNFYHYYYYYYHYCLFNCWFKSFSAVAVMRCTPELNKHHLFLLTVTSFQWHRGQRCDLILKRRPPKVAQSAQSEGGITSKCMVCCSRPLFWRNVSHDVSGEGRGTALACAGCAEAKEPIRSLRTLSQPQITGKLHFVKFI